MPDPARPARRKGPWYHRTLVWAFSIALGVLVYWLLGFIVNDIGRWPGPDYQTIEQQVLDQGLVARQEHVEAQLRDVRQDIEDKRDRQRDLRSSTDSAKETMNQLLDIQRLALERDLEPSEPERESLEEATQLFLTNQQQYQQINDEVATLNERRRTLEEQQRQIADQLRPQRLRASEVYQQRWQWHEIQMAAIKLAVLVPLLLIAAFLYLKWRHTLYLPMIYAFGIATAAKVGLVMHEHFPTRYFKYILIGVAIALVAWILVRLLRRVARPTGDWLLQQYRDAYERFLCPVCDYPIRRGPLRYRFWTRRSIKKLNLPTSRNDEAEEEPYNCPACTTRLYEKCPQCERVRPALLPACTHCGRIKSLEAIIGEG